MITEEEINHYIAVFARRCEEAKMVGISLRDATNGAHVPEDWILDHTLEYFLPPNFMFTDSIH